MPTNGSKDHLLSIRDLLNLTYSDWQKTPEGTIENPTIINDNTIEVKTIEVDDNKQGLLFIAKEVTKGITIKLEENKNNISTNSGEDSDKMFDFDSDSGSDFDKTKDGDKDQGDKNMA